MNRFSRFSWQPDLMYNWNNGFVFVVPLIGGWLDPLAWQNSDSLTGWCFGDQPDGQPVMVGSNEEGLEFVDMCVQLGLTVAHAANLSVPFSSGPRRRGEHAGTYQHCEYAKVRQDLPTHDELVELARVS